MRSNVVPAAILIAVACIAGARLLSQQPAADGVTDKYLFLEDASSPQALAWVKDHDERTAKVLEADPHFAPYVADALKIAEDPSRLPTPEQHGADVYNLWHDAEHLHGILRKTNFADYLKPEPDWHTVIDYDALSKQDNTSWVAKSLNCLYPGDSLCLVKLSAGGEDAETLREFDLRTGQFVPGGFVLPHSKQDAAWVDANTLYVGRDWGQGSMTKSGYPYIVKEWKRGTPLDQAKEVYRGQESDIAASAGVLNDAQGDTLIVFSRAIDFFSQEIQILTPGGAKRLMVPGKSQLSGLLAGRVLLNIDEDWTPAGQTKSFRQGSLLSMDLKDVLADPAHLKPTVVFEPTAQEFMEKLPDGSNGTAITRNHLLLTTLDHVQGRAYVYTPTATGWTRKTLPVPANVSVDLTDASNTNDTFFLTITGFLTPSSVFAGDAEAMTLKLAHSDPNHFDASNEVVEQLDATSKDGTKIPYFIVHSKSMKYDGSNPTLLTAYGGFQVSSTPAYLGYAGKLWLEHGGVYVVGNIRGGGEFGPAWHDAGLKTKRQVIYDDFAAVAQDLIARKITSSKRLGIQGGSNGGLLMGVEMTQHPDLFGAIVIQVPLLDMLRYEQIAAGASWVGEYGSVSIPAERAFLASISPYNQLKPGVKYPTPLIFTTTKDDRVGPQHARKFAAKMEEYHDPFFYDEIVEGGHGAGANLAEEARTRAEVYVYLTRELMTP
ncbi:MAG: prolyl oligopeptidase family serine peptidase [Acidobacteriaceae bacterium]|jgi:prolyl oligopeptidase